MNKKVLFVFLILSITPFMRSCSMTLGFPLVSSPDFGENQIFITPAFIFVSLLNIAILFFMARKITKNQKFVPWLRSIYHALLVMLYLHWSMLCLTLVAKGPFSKLPVAILAIDRFFTYQIPADISYKFTTKLGLTTGFFTEPFPKVLDDIIFRSWFLTMAILLTFLFYGIERVLKHLQRIRGNVPVS